MYNKLFTKILDSSIWMESMPTRLVWLTFIAGMDEDSIVQFASTKNVAHRARVSFEEAEEAIRCLENPDKHSPDQEFEGRRIERIDGGWRIIKGQHYRGIATKEVARQKNAERQRNFRARHAAVTHSNAAVTPSEAEAEAEAIPLKPDPEPLPDRNTVKRRTHAPTDDASSVPPVWRKGARRADPKMRHIGYHDEHCAPWARAACDAGICVPKYEWPKWERRKTTAELTGFVDEWAKRCGGDMPEKFWPQAFEQHFGARFKPAAQQAATTRNIPAAADTDDMLRASGLL